MSKAIGPTFGDEIHAAGLDGLPFSWTADGTLNLDSEMLTDQQRVEIKAVYDAHDPLAVAQVKMSPDQQTIAALQSSVDTLKSQVALLNAKVFP